MRAEKKASEQGHERMRAEKKASEQGHDEEVEAGSEEQVGVGHHAGCANSE
jgi:hypothetical protein